MKQALKKATTLLTAVAVSLSVAAGSSVTAKAADEGGIRAFVTRMYEVCLGREPEEAGLADWSGRLQGGQARGADIAFGFVFSEEFRNMNLCREHYVDSMYAAFFGRTPDEQGKADWMQALSTGKTRGHVLTGFVNSQEFDNLCASYGIVRGEGDWSADEIPVGGICSVCTAQGASAGTIAMTDFASRLYTECLEREAEEAGLQHWAKALASGASGSEVASGFIFSEEYRLKDASDTQYVLMLYRTMLGREPETRGVTDWVLRLRNGASREVVFNGFLGSAEFANLCSAAGILVGEAIADGGTTGRQSTGLDVKVRRDKYEYGVFVESNYFYVKEGELINLRDAFILRPGSTKIIETEPFIAYEGVVGTVNTYYP
ncbi:MAG: DUF4214 domain-containing protein [Clostridiales bacterium]|nr:DUF4214 domain-containing protein [Clostridiales bacterium]